MSDRSPRLGDLLVVRPDVSNRHFVGVVDRIDSDMWGHSEKVFLIWQTEPAIGYDPSFGYSGMNIHNHRRSFRIIRDGAEVK